MAEEEGGWCDRSMRLCILICLFVVSVPLIIAGIALIYAFPEDDTG